MNNKGFFTELFTLSCIVSCIIGIVYIAFAFVSLGAINGGEHTGIVTAVEHRHNLIWDADIVYFKTDAESTQENLYCVNDYRVERKLKEFARTRERVTVLYANKFFFMKWDCNGGETIVYDAIPVEAKYESSR